LVVGKSNGNFSQLKLDLNEAKSFAGPGEGLIPAAIHWASTTQFLILFIVANTDLGMGDGKEYLVSTENINVQISRDNKFEYFLQI